MITGYSSLNIDQLINAPFLVHLQKALMTEWEYATTPIRCNSFLVQIQFVSKLWKNPGTQYFLYCTNYCRLRGNIVKYFVRNIVEYFDEL